ncbi:MAG: cytochrome c-type biogenesis protein CcmH [Anaerolineales bacterium]
MRRYSGLLASLLLILVMTMATNTALAQEEQPSDDDVNAVAKGLYCPVCENVPLDVCPTQACKQWRNTIGEKLALGWSQKQIEQYFVNQYGDRVLATPPATGLNWLIYLLPPLVFIVGAVVLGGAVRSWRKPTSEPVTERTIEPTTDPYLEKVEEELRRRG